MIAVSLSETDEARALHLPPPVQLAFGHNVDASLQQAKESLHTLATGELQSRSRL